MGSIANFGEIMYIYWYGMLLFLIGKLVKNIIIFWFISRDWRFGIKLE